MLGRDFHASSNRLGGSAATNVWSITQDATYDSFVFVHTGYWPAWPMCMSFRHFVARVYLTLCRTRQCHMPLLSTQAVRTGSVYSYGLSVQRH